MPQPKSGRSSFSTKARPTAGPCDVYLFDQSSIKVGSRSLICEPSVSLRGYTDPRGTTAFATGNWFAALSTDSGKSWSKVDPYSKFRSLDGGFCCDQRTMYASETDMTFWYLQYSYSKTTQRGSVRVAYCRGGEINTAAFPLSKVFTPEFFGRPRGEWLDFPDVAISASRVWFTSNIFDSAARHKGSVIWNMKLAEVHGSTPVNFIVSNGGSPRLVQGAEDTMYAARHKTNSSLHVYKWSDATGRYTEFDVMIPMGNLGIRGQYVSKAPNGVNWTGRMDSRITAGYCLPNAGEYGFGWPLLPQAGRPQVFARFARIREVDDKLAAAEDTWDNNVAFAYPACHGNPAGGIGFVVAAGGSKLPPTTLAAIVDECYPTFDRQHLLIFAPSAHSPTKMEWGDFFTVQPHPVRTTMFAGTGMGMIFEQIPAYAWFGRAHDSHTWIPVSVGSKAIDLDRSIYGFTGLTIGCATDYRGRKSVKTNGYLTYLPDSGFNLTAPNVHRAGNTVYEFNHWNHRPVPWGKYNRVNTHILRVSNLRKTDDQAIAYYNKAREIAITSRALTTGVPVNASIADVLGSGSGATPVTRYYTKTVTFRVPRQHSANNNTWNFKRWWINGRAQSLGNEVVVVRNDDTSLGTRAVRLEAEYESLYRTHRWPPSGGWTDGWGKRVVAVGDMDRDGHGDYVTSAPLATNLSRHRSGVVYAYSGRTQAPLGAFVGPVAGAQLGTSLASADFDQDGYGDVMVGGAGPYNGQASNIYFISGKTRKLEHFLGNGAPIAQHLAAGRFDKDKHPDLVRNWDTNWIQAVSFRGKSLLWQHKLVGKIGSLAVAGDKNGDGYDEVLVGMPTMNNNAGRFEVRSGRDGTILYALGGNPGDELGYAVSRGGSLTGAWGTDYAVSAPGAGQVRFYVGWSDRQFAVATGPAGSRRFGVALAATADQDGDGLNDIMVSGVDASGKGFVRVLKGNNLAVLRELRGETSAFGDSLASIDTNGDSLRDLLIGEPGTSGRIWCYDRATVASPPAWQPYGATCAGTGGRLPRIYGSAGNILYHPQWVDGARARIGGQYSIFLGSAAKSSVAIAILGFTPNSLPLDGLGMTGCVSLVNGIVQWGVASDRNGAARFGPLSIPSDQNLVGAGLFWQWLVVDPSANSFGLTTSDAARMRIGRKL